MKISPFMEETQNASSTMRVALAFRRQNNRQCEVCDKYLVEQLLTDVWFVFPYVNDGTLTRPLFIAVSSASVSTTSPREVLMR